MTQVVRQGVCILGATGSIGQSTLDVLRRHPERWSVASLGANQDVERMLAACLEFRPPVVAMADEQAAARLATALKAAGLATEVLSGEEGMQTIAADAASAVVVAAIVGAAGLCSSLAAVRAGKRVLLANKEALVMSGDLFMAEVAAHGATLIPLDSEHNALFQCLPHVSANASRAAMGVESLILTASGGPFLEWSAERLLAVTPEQACAHPNWSMGKKISVDSASLMNKGLEVIEAFWLFGMPLERIKVVVHPQSIVHSMVAYADGSVLAQLGLPDMRTPIAHALAWPERVQSGVAALDLTQMNHLSFVPPDTQRFPCLRLAYDALRQGGLAPAVLNAANEVAVDAFLQRRLGFTQIPALIEAVLNRVTAEKAPVLDQALDDVFAVDRQGRALANEWVQHHGKVS
ncbi:MAG: 1-deoxy-D-xylulose-5-phosphate reductoisomerase [Gammaproteobacteria bacterium 28-57-27]|nr:MAG: 1-deoxy-D-xylulose-5-phosphate reductoisomerase [Gammaproteobacteria bacterium 28-57-27]